MQFDPMMAVVTVVGGGIFGSIACLLDRNEARFRCRGIASHICLWVFAAVPMLLAPFLAKITQVPAEDFAVPGIAFIIATLCVHAVVPAAAEDFTSSSLGSSIFLAVIMVLPQIMFTFINAAR